MPYLYCPRIRLTKTDKSHLILPVDAITGIEESRRDKCTKVYTLDGFWYEVVNPILEVDTKINEAHFKAANPSLPTKRPATVPAQDNQHEAEKNHGTKSEKIKRKKFLSAGVDKIARREPEVIFDDAADESLKETCVEITTLPQEDASEEDSDASVIEES